MSRLETPAERRRWLVEQCGFIRVNCPALGLRNRLARFSADWGVAPSYPIELTWVS